MIDSWTPPELVIELADMSNISISLQPAQRVKQLLVFVLYSENFLTCESRWRRRMRGLLQSGPSGQKLAPPLWTLLPSRSKPPTPSRQEWSHMMLQTWAQRQTAHTSTSPESYYWGCSIPCPSKITGNTAAVACRGTKLLLLKKTVIDLHQWSYKRRITAKTNEQFSRWGSYFPFLSCVSDVSSDHTWHHVYMHAKYYQFVAGHVSRVLSCGMCWCFSGFLWTCIQRV